MKKTLCLLLFVCLAVIRVGAQQYTLKGHVQLEGDSVTTVATVYIHELNRVCNTDASGNFIFAKVQPGSYKVQISALGYETRMLYMQLHADTAINLLLEISSFQTEEVVVYGNISSHYRQTPYTVSQLSLKEMRQQGTLSLSDAIAQLPGVTQLTTGAGISKPVIRGLYGNRIQTVLMGLRFDNQQWQDEHGLGLGDIGVDRVEVIKGPAALIYGSQAMGGVLNIVEEKPAAANTLQTDASLRAFSNTRGLAADAGVRKSSEKSYWRLRVGGESHADYQDGNNNRILNSRFDNYVLKSTYGFNRKRWSSATHLMAAKSDFGFVMDSAGVKEKPDTRLSRSFAMPHHTVLFQVLSSQNTILLRNSMIKANVGVHLNNRQEQEGGNRISLNMQLNTYSASFSWVKPLSSRTELSLGTQGTAQQNRNMGSRVIIPDADMQEYSGFVYLKHQAPVLNWEGGFRYDQNHINSLETKNFRYGGKAQITPFNRNLNAMNASLGVSVVPHKNWNLKVNAATGYRAPNLAELSSNGLREGTIRWEVGDMLLKNEQNLCAEASVNYESRQLNFEAAVYNNRFFNYIYMSPTGEDTIGLDIYRYLQHNALLQGTELAVQYRPVYAQRFTLKSSYSSVVGRLDGGGYLPFIPANKLRNGFTLRLGRQSKPAWIWNAEAVCVFAQNKFDAFEQGTNGYWLFNSGLSHEQSVRGRNLRFSITGNNLLNKNYFDHLSRFKYFGIHNMGRNVVVQFAYSLTKSINKK